MNLLNTTNYYSKILVHAQCNPYQTDTTLLKIAPILPAYKFSISKSNISYSSFKFLTFEHKRMLERNVNKDNFINIVLF